MISIAKDVLQQPLPKRLLEGVEQLNINANAYPSLYRCLYRWSNPWYRSKKGHMVAQSQIRAGGSASPPVDLRELQSTTHPFIFIRIRSTPYRVSCWWYCISIGVDLVSLMSSCLGFFFFIGCNLLPTFDVMGDVEIRLWQKDHPDPSLMMTLNFMARIMEY